jgi:hypothetical protein
MESAQQETQRPLPIWVLLASMFGISHDVVGTEIVKVPAQQGWKLSLLNVATAGSVPFLLVGDAGRARSLLRLLAHGRWEKWSGPSRREVIRTAQSLGISVEHIYILWPSTDAPRVAVRLADRRAMRWVQGSGVLGGGGDWVVTRFVARWNILSSLVTSLAPGYALVCIKQQGKPRR